MCRNVVKPGVQDATALGKVGVVRPEVSLVLVAPHAGIYQIVWFVTPTGCARPIVIQGELAPAATSVTPQ